jgi:hypothetical protein
MVQVINDTFDLAGKPSAIKIFVTPVRAQPSLQSYIAFHDRLCAAAECKGASCDGARYATIKDAIEQRGVVGARALLDFGGQQAIMDDPSFRGLLLLPRDDAAIRFSQAYQRASGIYGNPVIVAQAVRHMSK